MELVEAVVHVVERRGERGVALDVGVDGQLVETDGLVAHLLDEAAQARGRTRRRRCRRAALQTLTIRSPERSISEVSRIAVTTAAQVAGHRLLPSEQP